MFFDEVYGCQVIEDEQCEQEDGGGDEGDQFGIDNGGVYDWFLCLVISLVCSVLILFSVSCFLVIRCWVSFCGDLLNRDCMIDLIVLCWVFFCESVGWKI